MRSRLDRSCQVTSTPPTTPDKPRATSRPPVDIVDALIQAGADVNALDHTGCSPLYLAEWASAPCQGMEVPSPTAAQIRVEPKMYTHFTAATRGCRQTEATIEVADSCTSVRPLQRRLSIQTSRRARSPSPWAPAT
jgi:hypothetical protein